MLYRLQTTVQSNFTDLPATVKRYYTNVYGYIEQRRKPSNTQTADTKSHVIRTSMSFTNLIPTRFSCRLHVTTPQVVFVSFHKRYLNFYTC